MNALYTILLLLASNVFMTLAWYGHLKLQNMGIVSNATPLVVIILLSWGIAFFEYCLQVPANRMGFEGNGGPFTMEPFCSMPAADCRRVFRLWIQINVSLLK